MIPIRARRKLQNLLHSVALIGGMMFIAGVCAWTVWGATGLFWAATGIALVLVLSPSIPPHLVLRMYQAQPIGPRTFPEGYAIMQELARRAELPALPQLYYVPSTALNAFSIGTRNAAAVAVSDGMLRTLTLRELAAVLAHEISHIANNDLWIMKLADVISRATSFLSYFGIFLLLLNVPLLMTSATGVPWLLVLLFVFAPTLMSLLQLALSRTREYEADLDAARLTNDPSALASALAKLERYQGRFWEEIVLPGRRIPEPSLLRTHPPTDERVRRLLQIAHEPRPLPYPEAPDRIYLPSGFQVVQRPPRWRRSGLWY